jgi:2-methylcitrate dehydratase PrpD
VPGGEGGAAEFVVAVGALDHSFTNAIGGLSLKRFPACGVNQAPIEAALQVAAREGFDVAAVEEVRCRVDPFIRNVLIGAPPRNGNEARFSLEHCVAVAMQDQAAGLAQFSAERVNDRQVRALAAKVSIVDGESGARGPDMRWPCALTVRLAGGRMLEELVDQPQGRGFGQLLAEPDLLAKFEDCAAHAGLAPEATRRALELMADLERLDDAGELARACAM